MDEKEVINILRHYRHDLLNHLQIIQGYISMGKTDKADLKIKEYVQVLNEERKLANLNIPEFNLYLTQFNYLHTNFRLTYHIHTESSDLTADDAYLLRCCREIIEEVKINADDSVLYHILLELNDTDSSSVIELKFHITGKFSNMEEFISRLTKLGLDIVPSENEETLVFSFHIRRG